MNGFQSPNYTQTPNDLFDSLLPEMGLAELKVVMCVIRHTFGYHREEIKLSLRDIARFTGLTANSVMDGATQAENHGLIERIQDGNKTTLWRAIVSVVPTKTPRRTKRDANVSPTATQVRVKEIKKDKKEIKQSHAIKANDFPTNILYREVTEKYPKKANWYDVLKYMDGIQKRLGRVPTKDDLMPFYSAWCANGWNEWSINWLEYAVSGDMPVKRKNAPVEVMPEPILVY